MTRRPCWLEISTGAFEENYRKLATEIRRGGLGAIGSDRSLELLAIVKANAYGHGLEACAPAAARAGASWLGVTSVEEGVAARRLSPEQEILVIGGVFHGQGRDVIAARLTTVVWDSWQVDELDAAAREAGVGQIAVHLELDTGMSRQGVGVAELDGLLPRLEASALRLDGLMTHLYAADEWDGEATRAQMQRLEAMVERVLAGGAKPTWLHVGNSAALLAGEVPRLLVQLCSRWGLRPMVRPGLALYGLIPGYLPDEPVAGMPMSPVLTWKTEVVSLRDVAAGDVVGYNGTFVATEPMRLALLAVGYGDGLRRALSNRGAVLVAGCRAPIVGRISMDQTIVDVSEIDGVAAGDEVVLLGRQGIEVITAHDHARWAETIPWEILTSITSRVERRIS